MTRDGTTIVTRALTAHLTQPLAGAHHGVAAVAGVDGLVLEVSPRQVHLTIVRVRQLGTLLLRPGQRDT